MRLSVFLAALIGLSFSFAWAQPLSPPPVQTPPQVLRRAPNVVAPICSDHDCDHDGHLQQGPGDDCDDNDAHRFPGNTEIGDPRGHDEDCDLSTFGFRDADGDGYVTDAFFNADASGRHVSGGTDCDDQHGFIHPNAQELPNHVDDDCNGVVDDLYGIWWTPPPGWSPRDGVPPVH